MKSPKFTIDQMVNHKPDLYKNTLSKVTEIDRLFNNHDGGLAYVESHLSGMRADIKWEIIEGETPILVIHPYATTEWSMKESKHVPCMSKRKEIKFDTYCYTVSNKDMNTIFSERQLKAAK